MATSCRIIIDDRERAVVDTLTRDFSSAPSEVGGATQVSPWWRVERLNYGDYALMSPSGATMMIIERKTYSDFAQSIKDNRIANFAGLISLRAQNPNIRLAILLEGPRPSGVDTRVDGIPFKCIRAKINHLILRDDFHLIETQSATDTARYLRELAIDASSLQKGALTPAAPAADEVRAPITGSSESSSCAAMQKKHLVSIDEEVCGVFSMFPNIGKKYADLLILQRISITEFVAGIQQHAIGTIARLSSCYQSKRTTRIDRAALMAICGVSRNVVERLVPDTTPNELQSLKSLCSLSRDELIQRISTEGHVARKLGGHIYDCLHYVRPWEGHTDAAHAASQKDK